MRDVCPLPPHLNHPGRDSAKTAVDASYYALDDGLLQVCQGHPDKDRLQLTNNQRVQREPGNGILLIPYLTPKVDYARCNVGCECAVREPPVSAIEF